MGMIDMLRYPIGKFEPSEVIVKEQREVWIQDIGLLPGQLRQAIEGLNEEQLDTAYRPGGWTVRQVVHHVADSHMNAFIRLKLALTEEVPTIKPYEEGLWAELNDSRTLAPEVSLRLLDSLHERWIALLHSLSEADWSRTFRHPQSGIVDLANMAGTSPGTASITPRILPRFACVWAGEPPLVRPVSDGLVTSW